MNILLLGSGGREHALAWKLARSRLLSGADDTLYAAPGNPGIAAQAQCVALDPADHDAVTLFCSEHRIGLVVIGPEAPLVDGLADSLSAAGFPVFGPSAAAARLEGSKAFTKALCQRAGIPTARYARANSLEAAWGKLRRFDAPFVLKADGLAAGKGVVIAQTREDAQNALAEMFDGRFGHAGSEVVIEEFLPGEEASFFALTDGITIVPFGTAQDHKRVGDGDTGPNTGGMGAYSPAPVLSARLQEQVLERIIAPTITAMREAGHPYAGVLYAGLMLTPDGPSLIEYNCRFGDPECQVLMMRLESDLGELMLACAQGRLAQADPPRFSNQTALTVVMAARGYPDAPAKGGVIDLRDAQTDGVMVFHAGTGQEDGKLVAHGGRVLNVTAMRPTIAQAQRSAYAATAKIDFPDGFYRHDIGWRQIERDVEA